jgi:predicted lipid-binding transport protein (Tim44 family)
VKQRLLSAALAALAFCAPPGAFGRVGGGSHAAGGAHPGFSTHGGGSGGGGFGAFITLVIIVLVIWYLYRRAQRNRGQGSQPPTNAATREVLDALLGAATAGTLAGNRTGSSPAAVAEVAAAVDAIRTRDPNFDMETFLQRAEMTFYLVKRAISNNDSVAVRPYLNDALYAQISQMLQQRKSQHRHDLLESLNVRGVHVIHADVNAQSQSLLVHFDLVYRGKTLDDAQHVLADEGQDTRHGERWTFVRAAAAVTPAAGGVTASRCPACGAELRLNLDGSCAHCRASVTNGTVDWVVTAVQSAPFIGHYVDGLSGNAAPSVADGIGSLKAADTNFSIDAFCQRVASAFTALQDAWCKQNLDTGRAFLSPGAYFAWRSQLETMAAQGRRNVMEQLQILQVEPMRIVHGQVFDDLTVRITASCADYEVDQSNRVVFGDRSVRPFTEDWTFQRSVGVSSSGKPGTLESTCPRCGAPVQLTQIGECRFCKAAVTSGKFDWVVSRIEQEDDDEDAGDGRGGPDIGSQIEGAIGGAIIGGLLGSLLGGNSDRDDS